MPNPRQPHATYEAYSQRRAPMYDRFHQFDDHAAASNATTTSMEFLKD
jgi:hypothetical protein